MKPSPKSDILRQIAQINLMERGTLSVCQFKDRSPDAPQHFKLQCWENGQNQTRHVTQDQLPLVKEALAGFAKFRALTDQLAAMVITETRQQLQELRAGAKKKTRPPSCGWPKTKKSNS